MLNFLKLLIFLDGSLDICFVVLIFLLFIYKKTRDGDLKYFIFSDVFYILGEISFNIFDKPMNIPIDSIFYFFFYFFIFLFLRRRNKNLLKNPTIQNASELGTWILLIIDFFILAALSYLIFYYFDRPSLPSQVAIYNLDYTMLIGFLYPVLDFLLLGYYIYIHRTYIVSDRIAYIPVSAGILIWTIADFLFAFEEMFRVNSYGIGDYLQILGLVLLILVVFLVKNSKIDSDYTTIDLYQDNSNFGNLTVLMNGLIVAYLAIYLYCFKSYANSMSLMNTVREFGIILLVLSIIRQNVINYSFQLKINKLAKDASTDPLTGLYSRKYAFSLMQNILKSSLYFNISISALMLDIDHFKKFNDAWGHILGDHVLKDIAQLINSSIDTSNIVCRYGGEEFLIVLPGIDQSKGLLIAENIRKNIESHNFHEGKPKSVEKITVSIGGATAVNKTQKEIDLIEQADTALYKAKEERNKCSWFSS